MSTVNKTKVIESLRELSDEGFQQAVWTATSGPKISSFTEAICGLFDDSGLGDALGKGKVVISAKVDDLLRMLGNEIDAVEQSLPVERLLTDPKIVVVRRRAAELLDMIEKHREDEGPNRAAEE